MPHKCETCKQFKPCRKVEFWESEGISRVRVHEWVCKDCDDFNLLQRKLAKEKDKLAEEKRIKEFIKKRDKILKTQLKRR